MAMCSVCGQFSGFAKTHPACREALDQGRTVDNILQGLRYQAASSETDDLNSATRTLMILAGLLTPIITLACMAALGALLTSFDKELLPVGLFVGALAGIFVATFFYNWIKLHALFVRRVVDLLSQGR